MKDKSLLIFKESVVGHLAAFHQMSENEARLLVDKIPFDENPFFQHVDDYDFAAELADSSDSGKRFAERKDESIKIRENARALFE